MPNNLTLLDLAKLNGSDAVVGLIEEVQTASPEVGIIPARTISGTSYKTAIRSKRPSVGFRKANEGTDPTKSEFTERLVECFILSSIVEVDKAIANAYEDGVQELQAIEAMGVMAEAMTTVGTQTIYGKSADEDGFFGLQALQAALENDIEVDAGGSTADTASSVYFINAGVQGVQYVYGNNSTFDLSPFREQIINKNNKSLPAYVADLTSWVGLQCVNKNAVGRIYNITEDGGNGLTDALADELFAKFPIGMKPTHCLMSRRSQRQLQVSRQVTINSTGNGSGSTSGITSPPPTELAGVPIIVTDSLVNTEAIVTP